MAEEATKEEVPTKEEMTELLNEEVTEVEIEAEGGEESPDYTEAEQEAMEMGWSPEGVEGKKNLTAEEFVDRKALYDDLHSLKRQNKRLQGDIENINKYQADIREDERKKVVEELKTQKIEALDDGDHKRVVEIDEQLAEEAETAKVEKAAVKETNEDFEEWVSSNAWYNDDKELRSDADVYGEVYWSKNPEKSRNEVYDAVEKYVKRNFPDKFENPARTKPATVEPSGSVPRKGKSKTKFSAKDLDSEQRSVMKTIIRTTNLTEEQYLKDYFDRNGK